MKLTLMTGSLIAAIFLFFMVGCNKEESMPSIEKPNLPTSPISEKLKNKPEEIAPSKETIEAVTKAVTENLSFAEKEDKKGYLNTLSSEYRNDEDTHKELDNLFEHYDMKYEILDIKVLEETDEHVLVQVKEKAEAKKIKAGFSYTNHIATAKHMLIKENGSLKFSKSDVTNIQNIE